MKASLTTGRLGAVLRDMPARHALASILPPEMLACPNLSRRLTLEERVGPEHPAWLVHFIPNNPRSFTKLTLCTLGAARSGTDAGEPLCVAVLEAALPGALWIGSSLTVALDRAAAALACDDSGPSTRDVWLPEIVPTRAERRTSSKDVDASSESALLKQLQYLSEPFKAGAGLIARHGSLDWQIFRDRVLTLPASTGGFLHRAETALGEETQHDEALDEFRRAILSGRLLPPDHYVFMANALHLPDEARRLFVTMSDGERTVFLGSLVVAAQIDSRTGTAVRSLLKQIVPPAMSVTYASKASLFGDATIAAGLKALFAADAGIYVHYRKEIIEQLLTRKSQAGLPLDKKGLLSLIGETLPELGRSSRSVDASRQHIGALASGFEMLICSMSAPAASLKDRSVVQFQPRR